MNGTMTSRGEPVPGDGAPAADVSRIAVRLLRGVERLPAGATGALIFGDKSEPSGSVLVENGRICWAAAAGMTRRLTDILMEQSRTPLSRDTIEEAYERCRLDGTPLGASLVARGIVTPRGLRDALLTHTGDAIALLSEALREEGKVSPAWVPNRTRRYDAQFTFNSTEILVAVGVRSDKERGLRAKGALENALQDGAAGAAFRADPQRELPICEIRGEQIGVEGLVELGRWAHFALERSSRFSPAEVVAATSASRSGALAWSAEGVVYTALCEDRAVLSYLMSRRSRGELANAEKT